MYNQIKRQLQNQRRGKQTQKAIDVQPPQILNCTITGKQNSAAMPLDVYKNNKHPLQL